MLSSLLIVLSLLPAPVARQSAAPVAPQHEDGAWAAGTMEIGGLGGYADGKVYDAPRTPTSLAIAAGRFALHFGPTGTGFWRGNIAIVAEGVLLSVDQEPRATGGGLNLLFRYTWAAGRWRPMFLAGAGVLFTDEAVPPGETTRNYMPQTGVGVQYLIAEGLALGGEYRFHHISNNRQTDTNPGINTHMFLFGVSWYR